MYKTKGFILHIKTICIKIRDFSTFSKSQNDKEKATCQHKSQTKSLTCHVERSETSNLYANKDVTLSLNMTITY